MDVTAIASLLAVDVSFLTADWLGRPAWMWLSFFAIVGFLLVFDLGVLHRKPHVIGLRESLVLSAAYIAIALGFTAWVWTGIDKTAGQQFLTGYLIEKTLSLDNIFVISLVFRYFAIPRRFQHRVLFWGILGVIVLRGAMIGAGVVAIHRFEWVLLVFAVFLFLTGVKMLVSNDEPPHIENNPILRLLRRYMRVTSTIYGSHFFVREVDPKSGRIARFATPLFLALVLVEISDIIFAVDSVPAIFAITTDPFIVYTSNIFAILGLRALYFALEATLHRFHYLKHALSLVLMFIGGKIVATELMGVESVPASVSLGVTLTLIFGGIIYSVLRSQKDGVASG